ncbi:carboxypeptidase-like regulatory domain-containing protein [Dyadobacter sp. 32]|uniref:carboxypeptidase-like regulatory domain-containing protein n=1 Tax=Dyadobacter sp. 32 TaxID=538966 RepID=UPI0039C5D048
MNYSTHFFEKNMLLVFLLMAGSISFCPAQKLLNKPISITANRQSVSLVLQTISKQAGFYFSYNSSAIPGDSIVSIQYINQPLRVVLNGLLAGNYLYKETGDYIILQKAPTEKFSYISGSVIDDETGKPVDYASVYSKLSLVSVLTEDNGSFRLRLREHAYPYTLNISKIGYADTLIVVHSEKEGAINIGLIPRAIDLDEVQVYNSGGDRTWLARLFVSSRLRAQSRNIGQFFVALPFQASLTPGLGTHGRMSAQVVNKFSLNLLGGYTAGVNGLELAGIFNISKHDVRWAQAAGVFNVVSGQVNGVQIAGLHNHVIDSLEGVQAAGFGNIVNESVKGVQLAGFFNKAKKDFRGIQIGGAVNLAGVVSAGVQLGGVLNVDQYRFKGVQIAGAVNWVAERTSGIQIAGVANIGKGEVKGLQMGTINYARHLKGIQIGVINIADSSSGYSIGIFNIIKHGKGSVSVFANEVVPLNVAWKTGNRKMYSILTIGSAVEPGRKAYTFGLGVGKDFRLNKSVTLAGELTSNTVYTGSWENAAGIYRLQSLLDLRLGKRVTLSAGPSVAILQDKQTDSMAGYRQYPPKTYANFNIGKSAAGWLGWQAGLSWNYGRTL